MVSVHTINMGPKSQKSHYKKQIFLLTVQLTVLSIQFSFIKTPRFLKVKKVSIQCLFIGYQNLFVKTFFF